MNLSAARSSKNRASTPDQTPLGRLCGSTYLFRNRYQVLQALGRGGFGVTYLAKDVTLPYEPECVIKQLHPKTTNPAILRKAAERFEREAKTLGQLGSHAQIPSLLDYFQEGDDFFLVQEYVRGANLTREVKQRGPLSELNVKRFIREILPVLQYVHSNQVIHRDIKPPNIIRCQDDNRLVLIDFGAVKEQIAEADDSQHKGPSTQFVGTVGFAAPEQLGLRPVYASDIYAIGVTCLYLLTGRPPMEFDTDPRTGEIRWRDLTQVSPYFGKILDKMLKVDPRDRYQSAEEVLRVLNLEPYVDNLAGCMNTAPRTVGSESSSHTAISEGYVKPISRTALEIRNWRARLAARQQGKTWKGDRLVVSSGYCG